MRMQQAVKPAQQAGKPVVYVLNGWNRWRASNDFLEWFKPNSGDASIYKLPQSEQFVQAGASSISVVEYAQHGAAAKATLELCNAVRKLAGFKKEY